MNIKSFFKNIFTKSADFFNGNRTLRLDGNGNPAFWTLNAVFSKDKPTTYQLLNDAYGRNPYVFNIIDDLSSISASLKRGLINDSGDVVENKDLEKLLKNPNSRDSNKEFYEKICANLLVKEAFVCGIAPIGMSQYTELIVPNIDQVTVNRGTRGEILSYTVTYYNVSFTFDPKDVLHIYKSDITYDSDNGHSVLVSNRDVYETNNEVWQSEKHLHRNKGINGVLYNDGNRAMSPPERKSIQAQYDKETQGINFGKVRISSTKLGFLRMGMNPTDLKSIESRLDHLRTLCAAYKVDSILYGDVQGTTFNNFETAEKRRMENAVLPLSNWIDRSLSVWLIQGNFKMANTELKVNIRSIPIMSKPSLEMSKKVIEEVKAGIITTEEANTILYPDGIENE